jgi:hypothetical protein
MARKVDKPIRLYVMTIFIVIAYGLLPLVSVFPFTGGFLLVGPRFLPFNGSMQVLYDPQGEVVTALLTVTLGLSLLSVASAVITFLGVREARWPTPILLTLNLVWWFFLVISAIMEPGRPADTIGLVGQLLFPPFWLGFVWWNWLKPDITAWLNYQAELEN